MRAIPLVAAVFGLALASPAFAQSSGGAGNHGQSQSAAGTNPAAPEQAQTYKPGQAGSAKWRKDSGVPGTAAAAGGTGTAHREGVGSLTGGQDSAGTSGSGQNHR